MKYNIFWILIPLTMVSCYESLEDRAKKECETYTAKNCPTPVVNNTRMDSMVYEENTRTIHYYHGLVNEADNEAEIKAKHSELKNMLFDTIEKDPNLKTYREAGFKFRYTYHSTKDPKKVLLDITYENKP